MTETKIYTYVAYGIPIKSEIPLKSLLPFDGEVSDDFIFVKLGDVPAAITGVPEFTEEICSFNVNEFRYHLPNIIKMYIRDGKEIVLEPLCSNIEDSLLYFYSNGLAAAVYQRKSILFHVSGVFLNADEVLLIAAPSGTGKSTTAVKLQELGYPLFTDDTAVLSYENGQIYAEASYPMVRLWDKSIARQAVFNEKEKLDVYCQEEYDKYGFHFHSKFTTGKFKVRRFVFLEKTGEEISVRPIARAASVPLLVKNIYRDFFLTNMKLADEQFRLVTQIANLVTSYAAIRPVTEDTFHSFATAIIDEVCRKNSEVMLSS